MLRDHAATLRYVDEMERLREATAEFERTRTAHDEARTALHDAIRAALAAGNRVMEVTRASPYLDRQRITQIRDGG